MQAAVHERNAAQYDSIKWGEENFDFIFFKFYSKLFLRGN